MDEPLPKSEAVAAGPILDGSNRDEKNNVETATAPAKTIGATSLASTIQSFTDGALHFLSHASNETLGACLVGLGASTYLVLGRVGLLFIGVAGGVVLHATWEGVRQDDRDEATKRAEQEHKREVGVQVAKRLLDWRSSARAAPEEESDAIKIYADQQLDFSAFEAETEKALNTFADAIIKDYVHYWYDPTIPGEESFPASCRRTLVAFLLSLSGHLKRKRPADAFLDFLTNASSIIIVFLTELASAMNASPNSSAEDAISTYLEMKPDSSLSYLLNQDSQNARLADAAEDILQAYLDSKAYNCPPVRAFLKQILANLVLGYTVTYCSDAAFINGWIVYGLEESETTKEVMNMVDAGVEGRQTEKVAKTSVSEVDDQARTSPMQSADEAAIDVHPSERPRLEHRRQTSRAEEAMDEAMREARRLTQMMIEEDERRAKEEAEKEAAASSSEDVSGATTQGVATPTSSQSDKERQDEEATAWSQADSSVADTMTSADFSSRPMTPVTKQPFTSFDQILPPQATTLTDSPERQRSQPAPLTLHNATISIFDDSVPGDRASIKAKPQTDYLIQIEPATSAYPGWMISRKFPDFEILHEVLRRISVITGVKGFHAELPKWRNNTKAGLRGELERYLSDAVTWRSLAESEGMKRFLEKDQGLAKSPGERAKGFGWPTPDAFGKLGGEMMGVLTKAPKQVAGGGKAVFGGVAGLVGGVGGKKALPGQTGNGLSRTSTASGAELPLSHKTQASISSGSIGGMAAARQSQESVRSLARGSIATNASMDSSYRQSISSQYSGDFGQSKESLQEEQPADRTLIPNIDGGLEPMISLPPRPDDMPADFTAENVAAKRSVEMPRVSDEHPRAAPALPTRPQLQDANPASSPTKAKKPGITERETSVAIELLFATINQLYTLSGAWQIRLTLLNAAKSFLLRPGNPQLLNIKSMLQTSLLDSNISDSGLAGHVYKLRENALPTEEEMEIWRRDYPAKTDEEKEELRIKARVLLVKKGIPMALQSIMGAAASGEALGKVFDALQVPSVGRGVVAGVLMQAVGILRA
ncbi:hypothetical protein LTR78_005610 [Recurvomyces mirabilis]|uniref:PXA domain-containing protein n=1 Tax=Recurvomyces mirabilis TaxID=574656 RepID=A0AAE0WMM4_9PEZI|nr:hypothetical protein LTR78_005610 [Recurvomyces mirabilis]KAK5151269.1 hypothetical protein LTS14_009439 [Recurvomyces mirabilis]